jgi:hypothetical protein
MKALRSIRNFQTTFKLIPLQDLEVQFKYKFDNIDKYQTLCYQYETAIFMFHKYTIENGQISK